MTADAKVGLLLGLVFIVIIAFLVNGLPNIFRSDETIATSIEPPVQNVILESPVSEPPVARDLPPRPTEPPAEEKIVPLPFLPDAETAVRQAAQESGAAVVAVVPQQQQQQRLTHYTVKDGQSLTEIAQIVYGPELGGKRRSVEQVAKANNLDSPDLIVPGQVLVMPDLTEKPAAQTQPAASDTLVEKFKDVLEKVTTRKKEVAETVKPAPRPQSLYVEYVVQPGDCLSEISGKQLGTSKRVDEIVKLNRDKISEPDDIMAGMTLRLPKQ